MKQTIIPAALLVFAGTSFAQDAGGEWVVSVYGGAAHTPSTDVHLTESNGTDLHLSGVSWTDESFEAPPYYGARLTHWTSAAPNWGIALDFVHPKIVAKRGTQVPSSGTVGGSPTGGQTLVSDVFSALEFSDGHNILSLNGLYRWNAEASASSPWHERFQPYVGLGAGVALPHVEVETANSTTREYQFVGPAFNALGGVNLPLSKHFSSFIEYRMTYADMNVDLSGGGRLELEPLTHMASIGLSYTF